MALRWDLWGVRRGWAHKDRSVMDICDTRPPLALLQGHYACDQRKWPRYLEICSGRYHWLGLLSLIITGQEIGDFEHFVRQPTMLHIQRGDEVFVRRTDDTNEDCHFVFLRQSSSASNAEDRDAFSISQVIEGLRPPHFRPMRRVRIC